MREIRYLDVEATREGGELVELLLVLKELSSRVSHAETLSFVEFELPCLMTSSLDVGHTKISS